MIDAVASPEPDATATGRLPALSEHAVLRYFSFVALYVAQGIPEGMTYFGIPAWMAMNGRLRRR